MGNCASVSFKKNVDLDLCVAKLQEVNASRFDGCLRIDLDDDGISVTTPEEFNFNFWRISPRKLEWKHPHGQIEWWIMEYVASYMVRSIHPTAKISDEGIEEKLEPDFDIKYPTALSWIQGMANSLKGHVSTERYDAMISLGNGMADLLKESTHASYWRTTDDSAS
jgi:hypothetical protein